MITEVRQNNDEQATCVGEKISSDLRSQEKVVDSDPVTSDENLHINRREDLMSENTRTEKGYFNKQLFFSHFCPNINSCSTLNFVKGGNTWS